MAKHYLDITQEKCPMTFVKVKLKIEELAFGDELEILLTEGEPIENVPKSIEQNDCTITMQKKCGEFYLLKVKK